MFLMFFWLPFQGMESFHSLEGNLFVYANMAARAIE